VQSGDSAEEYDEEEVEKYLEDEDFFDSKDKETTTSIADAKSEHYQDHNDEVVDVEDNNGYDYEEDVGEKD